MKVRIEQIDTETTFEINKVSSVTQFDKKFAVGYYDDDDNYTIKYFSLEKYKFSVWEI